MIANVATANFKEMPVFLGSGIKCFNELFKNLNQSAVAFDKQFPKYVFYIRK